MLAGVPEAGAGGGKKLEEAARLWARGEFAQERDQQQDRAEINEALDFFGLQAEGDVVPQAPVFWLWPENAEPWGLFMQVQTEWRGTQSREGLDKAGVERILRAQRVRPKHRRQRFEQIRVMERAALDEWAQARRRELEGVKRG